MRIHGGGRSLCSPPGGAHQPLVQQCRPPCRRAQCGSTEEDIASAHHPVVLISLSSSNAARRAAALNAGPRRRTAPLPTTRRCSSASRLFEPTAAPASYTLSLRGARRLCSPPGGAHQPLVQQCRPSCRRAQCGGGRSLCSPPGGAHQSLVQQCRPPGRRAQCGSTKEDIASAHHPAVLISLSSSSATVLEWRTTLQCSPSLPHRAQLQTH